MTIIAPVKRTHPVKSDRCHSVVRIRRSDLKVWIFCFEKREERITPKGIIMIYPINPLYIENPFPLTSREMYIQLRNNEITPSIKPERISFFQNGKCIA
jgi:hypothetical protein